MNGTNRQQGVERILNVIMTISSSRRGRTRAELFAAVPDYAEAGSQESRERMFERDKREILERGFPLEAVTDPWEESVVTYRMAEADPGREHLDLGEDEYTLLLLASAAWGDVSRTGLLSRAHAKVLSLGLDVDLDRSPGGFSLNLEAPVAVGPLIEALEARQTVTFRYLPASATVAEKRTVEPWSVGRERDHWYLLGYDRTRAAQRLFRISRMISLPRATGRPGSIEVPAGTDVGEVLASFRSRAGSGPVDLELEALPYAVPDLRRRPDARAAGDVLVAESFVLQQVPWADALEIALEHHGRARTVGPADIVEAAFDARARVSALHVGEPDLSDRADATPRVRPNVKSPVATSDRLTRLLAEASWIYRHQGAEVADMAAHFGTTADELVTDFQQLFVCGDLGTRAGDFVDYIDVRWDEGDVHIENAEAIGAPMRLTTAEALPLLAGLIVLRRQAGPVERDVIDHLSAKIAEHVGVDDEALADVRRTVAGAETSATGELVAEVRPYAADGTPLRLLYSDLAGQVTERTVTPRAVSIEGDTAYLEAWCHTRRADRLFRFDRIVRVEPSQEPRLAAVPRSGPDAGPDAGAGEGEAASGPGDPVTVEARLLPDALWVAEAFAAEDLLDTVGGAVLATIRTRATRRLVDAALAVRGGLEILSPPALRAEARRRAAEG